MEHARHASYAAFMESQLSPEQALDALAWQIELGADEALLDTPVNCFELVDAAPKATPAKPAKPAPIRPVEQPPAEVAAKAAAAAQDLPALRDAMEAFADTPLREAARNFVFADGRPGARVMIVGEAPGREEDARGLPFVGRAGQLLDRMFAAIGLTRSSPDLETAIYIANTLPWRPPQNRKPTADEIALFTPFLRRHIVLADPDVIVSMGNTPAEALLGRGGITRLRGNWVEVENRPCLPMYHPAYLLRQPETKREAWADLLTLKEQLRGTA